MRPDLNGALSHLLSRVHREAAEAALPRFHTVDLENLKSREFAHLRSQLRRTGGVVQGIIHPYFPGTRFTPPPRPEYLEQITEEISSAIAHDLPLVVFEPDVTIAQLKSRFIHNTRGVLYIVKTRDDDPTPRTADFYRSSVPMEERRQKAWREATDPLRKAGARLVVLSGRLVQYGVMSEYTDKEISEMRSLAEKKPEAQKWAFRSPLPGGCVPKAARLFLERGFDVSFSPLTSPHKI